MPAHYQDRIDQAAALSLDALGEEIYASARESGRTDPGAVVAAALGRAADAPADRANGANPYGLSPREREVLTLLVTGCSDKSIADALFISKRTASRHVAAILTKLGARSRAEAAVRAVRDALV